MLLFHKLVDGNPKKEKHHPHVPVREDFLKKTENAKDVPIHA